MFGPLTFPEQSSSAKDNTRAGDEIKKVECILCERTFDFPAEKESCLKHVFEDHQVVIGDVERIADIPRYFEFWKEKLRTTPVKEFCSTMLVDVTKDGVVLSDQEFFLLSDVDKDDKMIREKLQNDIIEEALDQQRFEREDKTYSHSCFICRKIIEPTRADYVMHLNKSHNILLGHPDNLVFIDKLVTTLENKMDNLQCLFCEKFFKDRVVLKEHMRKKGHKRVNPDLEFYDRFFIINYLEFGTKWKVKEMESKKEKKNSQDDEEEDVEDFTDWDENVETSIICLFCTSDFPEWSKIMEHMKTVHNFDYEAAIVGFDFYKQVKMVNYIRRQIYWNKCINCDEALSCNADLIEHMKTENHFGPPKAELFEKPEYYFPTYENDAFLSQLDDGWSDEEVEGVQSEDVNIRDQTA